MGTESQEFPSISKSGLDALDRCLEYQHLSLSQVFHCTVATSSQPAQPATSEIPQATLQIHAAKLRTEDGLGFTAPMAQISQAQLLTSNKKVWMKHPMIERHIIAKRCKILNKNVPNNPSPTRTSTNFRHLTIYQDLDLPLLARRTEAMSRI